MVVLGPPAPTGIRLLWISPLRGPQAPTSGQRHQLAVHILSVIVRHDSFFRQEQGFSELGVMSLSNRGRRLSVAPLAGVERQGRGSLGSGSLEVGISDSLPSDSRFIQGTHPLPGLQSRFYPGQGLGGRSSFVVRQGSNRASSSPFSGLLQLVICSDESLRSVEAGHRPLATESEGTKDILQDGDSSVSTSVSTSWRLDGV